MRKVGRILGTATVPDSEAVNTALGRTRTGETNPLIAPTWAKTIRVHTRGEDLWVRGTNPRFEYSLQDAFPDSLDTFRKYLRTSRESDVARPGYLVFADIKDDQELIRFVADFGPIDARKAKCTEAWVIAVQSVSLLRCEQRLMKAAVNLLRHLNCAEGDKYEGVDAIKEAVLSLAAVGRDAHRVKLQFGPLPDDRFKGPFSNPRQHLWARLASASEFGVTVTDSPEQIYWFGHLAMCDLLERFPRRLLFADGKLLTFPPLSPLGIRDTLYYMLREDYAHKRELKTCANPHCNVTFIPQRPDAKYHSQMCGQRLRKRKQYAEKQRHPNEQAI